MFTENNGNLALPPIVVFWWLVVGEWAEEMPPIWYSSEFMIDGVDDRTG